MRTTHRSVAFATLLMALSATLALGPAQPAKAVAAFDPPSSDFVSASSVTVSGSKSSGSTLVIRRGAAVVCTVTDVDAVTFSCPGLTVPNGIITFTGDETLADGSVQAMAPLTLRVLAPPTITGAGGSVVTTGRFTGTGEPGASIQLISAGPGGPITHSCPVALTTGFWSCVVDLPNGAYQVRARQSLASIGPEWSAQSGTVSATVDRTPPVAPIISVPRAGTTSQQTVTARGGGEPDALLQVFVNGELICETIVSTSGSWACEVRWPGPGTWTLQALQSDQAGNFSSASPRVEVRFAPPAPPVPAPPPGDATSPPPPAENPMSPSPAPGLPQQPTVPPSAETPDANWGTATGFGGSLPSARAVFERGGWLLAPLAGLAFLLFVALPVRVFAVYVVPRIAAPRWRLTGRNRPADLDATHGVDRGDVSSNVPSGLLFSPRVLAFVTLAGAAVIAALSGGIDTEVRYVRLVVGVTLGLAALNAFGLALPARIAGWVWRSPVTLRVLPGILLVALALALFSRFTELQPPLLVGVLIAATAVASARRRVRAGIAVAQTTGVAMMGMIGWAAHDLLTPSTGFWLTFWAETAAAIALGGLGSLLILLLPVGPLPGRTLYAVSRGAWAVVAVSSAALVGAVLGSGPAFPLPLLTLMAAAAGAVLCAITLWVRWVTPTVFVR